MSAFSENREYLLQLGGFLLLIGLLFLVLHKSGNDISNVPNVIDDVVDGLNGDEKTYAEAPEMTIDTNKDYKAIVSTNKGDFELDLFEKAAPVTVNNFVFLANENFYNGNIFHRVIKDFVIQAGDRNNRDGTGDAGYKFDDEINWDTIGLSDDQKAQLKARGFSSTEGLESVILKSKSLAMANSGPNTNGSQFFIVSGPDSSVSHLNGVHTVFGKVIEGWDVVQEIQNVEVGENDLPKEEIVIKSIEIVVE